MGSVRKREVSVCELETKEKRKKEEGGSEPFSSFLCTISPVKIEPEAGEIQVTGDSQRPVKSRVVAQSDRLYLTSYLAGQN